MTRTPGRQTNQPDETGKFAAVDVTLRDIGQSLIELGQQLIATGQRAEKATQFDPNEYVEWYTDSRQYDHLPDGKFIHEQIDKEKHQDSITRLLTGLRSFRGNHAYWERVAAEYALSHGFTQRRAAALLGVSPSTINRWAQNPVDTED